MIANLWLYNELNENQETPRFVILGRIEMQAELPDGWTDVSHTEIDQQLAREVSEGHPLFGVRVHPVARHSYYDYYSDPNGDVYFWCDVVLFELENGPDGAQYAEVELTWVGNRTPPWPLTEFYDSFDEWRDGFDVMPSPEGPSSDRRNQHRFSTWPLRTWMLVAIFFALVLLVMIVSVEIQ